jgi:hypothetical protein
VAYFADSTRSSSAAGRRVSDVHAAVETGFVATFAPGAADGGICFPAVWSGLPAGRLDLEVNRPDLTDLAGFFGLFWISGLGCTLPANRRSSLSRVSLE